MSSSADAEDMSLWLLPAKRAKADNKRKCLICRIEKNEYVRKALPSGISTLLSASKHRNDDVYERIHSDEDKSLMKEVYWHGSCYKSYTSRRNLSFVHTTDRSSSGSNLNLELSGSADYSSRTCRSKIKAIDWSLCLFCQRAKRKGCKALINISSFDACKSILAAAEARSDNAMILNIRDIDLIAAKAKYHSSCRASYVSKSNLKHQTSKEHDDVEECAYAQAFQDLLKEINPGILNGKAYDMSYLLKRFQTMLSLNGITSSSTYRSEKLKRRLKNHFSDSIVFQKLPNRSKSELIYSSSISVQSIINAASSLQNPIQEQRDRSNEKAKGIETNKINILYHAAQILRSDVKNCKGISIMPLSVDDISLDRGKRLLPQTLYDFLCLIISQPDKQKEDREVTVPVCNNSEDERRIIMLGQDIVHAATHSRVKTPKHVGLAVTVHHLTGSKQIVTMLNKMGHCSSYNDVEVINTSLAREIIAKSDENGVVVPSNISPGVFVQFAGDNNDLNEETLDGKQTTHATTLVAYQRQQFGPKPAPEIRCSHSPKQRSLELTLPTQPIYECSVRGKRPSVKTFLGKVQEDHFFSSNDFHARMDLKDLAWFLLRLNQSTLFSIDLNQDQQTTPSWTAFNAQMSSMTVPRTTIGYCPMIAGSPKEFSTVYTVLKAVQAMTKRLGQKHSVITFDLAIYKKAKEIQWRYLKEFDNLIVRMGGFHIALNFLSVIGKKFRDSGLEELLTESGVYGSNTTLALLQGKSYNRGVRAHKLIMEALLRLQWQSFCKWAKKEKEDHGLEDLDVGYIESILTKFKSTSVKEEEIDTFHALCESSENLRGLFCRFKSESKSMLFKFWESYLNMVQILLRFIRAEREGNWKLHLESAAEMVPHFFSMDRPNYSRWLPVYLAEMNLLEESAPEVYREFMQGNHAVSRSSQPFAQVWTDMALEQSINLDSKTKGGIIGITQKPGALERWFLTAHERAAITTATKAMCGLRIRMDEMVPHKEAGSSRVMRDEKDVKKLISTLQSVLMNPFDFESSGDDDTLQLANLATGVVLSTDLSNRLVDAEDLGRQAMKTFIRKRMNSNETEFWEPLSQLKIMTFSNMANKAQAKSAEKKLLTVNADRSLFARLLIASKSRDINLREILTYELSAVPFSLAHIDGSLRKTTKSILLSTLEEAVEVLPRLPSDVVPEPLTAYILDGMAVVQKVKTAGARTFGELAIDYFNTITALLEKNNCNRVDVVFDRYDKVDSIKEGEQLRRGLSTGYEIKITDPATPLPKKWSSYVCNPANKTNLQNFLSEVLIKLAKTRLKIDQQLVLAGCFQNCEDVCMVVKGSERSLSHLKSDHEEASTRMLLHSKDCCYHHTRVVVQSPNTDVAVLCVYVYQYLTCDQFWFRTEVKDKIRFIPIHCLTTKLGRDLSNKLPAFHALTGCETTSSLYQISKKKAWKALRDNAETNMGLLRLGELAPSSPETVSSAERFICSLYSTSTKAGVTANDVRYWIFCQKNQKNEDLPPTSDSLRLHIQRANYQTMVWKRCLEPFQHLPSPIGNGWCSSDNIVKPVLMMKDAAPEGLAELVVCKCKRSACTSSAYCVCRVNKMACTEACDCMGDESCHNPQTSEILDCLSSDDEA